MLWVVVGLGIWLVIDGLGSMLIYCGQKWFEHVPRVVRVAVGVVLVVFGVVGFG